MKRAAFTIATGRPVYLEMATALVRSFRLWHRDSDIRFVVVTDTDRSQLPADLSDLALTTIKPGEYGAGFTPKLHLDRFAPAEQSLFIDADCLCVGPLEEAFDRFSGHAVSVIGREISSGEWFGDVEEICARFQIPAMPRFNGGVYYLERGAACTRVYEAARRLLPQYDQIGFQRLRGHPNDEVLLSLAMALEGQKAIPERGDIMNSLLAGPGGVSIDVFKGCALLRNPKDHPRHNNWYEMEELRPRLVHFLGSDLNTYPYRQEIIRLRLVSERKVPKWAATLWAKLSFSFPWLIQEKLKGILRPLYHATLGPRRARPSTRF
jgi:hypothetical protein